MIGPFIEQRIDLPGTAESCDFGRLALPNTNVAVARAVIIPGVLNRSGFPNGGIFLFNTIVMIERNFISTLIHKKVVCVTGL